MSVTSGYVHVSIRNAQSRAAAAQRTTTPGGYAPAGYRQLHAVPATHETRPMTAPTPIVAPSGTPGPQPVANDTTARGFVLYVGLDESVAQAQGTSLGKLATQVRAFLATLSPEAQTHAAVALAPASAQGENIDVVRHALGDPTVNRRPRADAIVRIASLDRGSGLIGLSGGGPAARPSTAGRGSTPSRAPDGAGTTA